MKKDRHPRLKEGIPADPRDWAAADWQDLHEAIEKVKRNVRERHKEQTDGPRANEGSR